MDGKRFSEGGGSMKEVPLMGGTKSEFQGMVERMLANREWLDQNIDELISQYNVGEWIGISEKRVVAKGSDPDEVKRALGGALGEALIICVPDKDIPQPI
jgi:hypothetical protein